MEIALEAGADDLKTDDQGFEILTTPTNFESVHKAIEERGIHCEAAEITSSPDLTVPVNDESTAGTVTRMLEALEDHDDVQQVYSNADFPPEG